MTSKTSVEVNDDKVKQLNDFERSIICLIGAAIIKTNGRIESLEQRVREASNDN